MAAAIGMSLLSSSYQVANNLPNMLYELVMGGMLVTAFLPVYMGVRREQGREASNEYVGNLLGILLLVLGGISLLGTVFAPGFIWTQSFLSGDGGSMDTAAFMFRFFAIQILFYGLGSVFSGVLNAHRDYFWSTFAPVLNNVIVIASFMGFAPVSAQFGERAGIILIAAGTTLGVFVQMACQIPALGKHGVHPHIHIDFKDPALRQTIALGIPTLLATVCMFVSTSITNAAALVVQPETGPSVIAYARLWYTLPYALIAASLSTALYTELSHDAQEKDYDSVRTGISRGVAQMLFFLIPFALYLIVFARPLNMICLLYTSKELPCLILLSLFAALVSTTSVISMFPFRVTNSWSLPVFLARARVRWHLTLSMPRASVDTSRAFRAMRASSWARWTNPTWIQSTAFRRRCRSTKRRRLKTLARRLAP